MTENIHRSPTNKKGLRNINSKKRRELKRAVWEFWSKECYFCALPLSFEEATIDHLKSVAKGGTNHFSNLRPACLDCNLKKGDK